jgi:isopenicillin N synthase-like dioxygenase
MSSSTGLPVVDLGMPDAAAQIDRVLSQVGFLYLTGHGVETQALQAAYAAAEAFFTQSADIKQRYAYGDADDNFGYQAVEIESLDPASPPDLKEGYTMRDALRHASDTDRWPSESFRAAALTLYGQALIEARRVLALMAVQLGVQSDFFTELHSGRNVTLRFLRYPAGLAPHQQGQLGAGAHTDYGSITLLFQHRVAGLQVLGMDGSWQDAPPVEGAVVVNTGDLMERWTNGRYRSTLHRVVPIAGNADRYSIAFFVDPDPAVEVRCFDSCQSSDNPARHPPISAGEHIRRKISATHGRNK